MWNLGTISTPHGLWKTPYKKSYFYDPHKYYPLNAYGGRNSNIFRCDDFPQN